MIARLYKGWTLEIDGESYKVLGNQKIRKSYFYILEGAEGRVSLQREALLEGQKNGSIVVKG